MVVSTSFANARRPAAGVRLDTGIEVKRPQARGRCGRRSASSHRKSGTPWDRDRDADPDHAGLDPVGEVARDIAIAGEDAVAVFVLVDEREGGLEVGRAHEAEDGFENLFALDAYLRFDVVEEAGAEKESFTCG